MKCSEALKILKMYGWIEISQRGSHIKMIHNVKEGITIFPNHGSKELAKGTEKSLFKQAQIKR